jgi:hypothetical protein
VRTRRLVGRFPLMRAGGASVFPAMVVALVSASALAAPAPFRPARVEQVLRTTGFVVLPDLAVHRPKWIVMDYSFTTRGWERVVYADVYVYVNGYRARQAAIAVRSAHPMGTICACSTARVGNVLLTLTNLEHVKPAPPPHYASDRRVLIAALSKLGSPVSP